MKPPPSYYIEVLKYLFFDFLRSLFESETESVVSYFSCSFRAVRPVQNIKRLYSRCRIKRIRLSIRLIHEVYEFDSYYLTAKGSWCCGNRNCLCIEFVTTETVIEIGWKCWIGSTVDNQIIRIGTLRRVSAGPSSSHWNWWRRVPRQTKR